MKSLKQGVEEYLKSRCDAGFKLRAEKDILPKFISFMQNNGETFITIKLALAFSTLNTATTPERWAARLSIIRQFAKYWSTEDSRTEIPPKNTLPYSYRRKAPYIYDDEEVVRLLECPESGQPDNRFDQYTYFIFFGLLAVTGMRVSEVLSLKCSEINFNDRIITISKTKFQKSRYIPIHNSTAEAMENYSNYRNHCLPNSAAQQFFIDHNGNAIKSARVRNVFRKRTIKIGIVSSKGKRKPRLIDFRHTFAVKTLLQWYRRGVININSKIPLLSTYLGHVKPSNTYWYLTSTPQLLSLVMARCKSKKRRT